jgi:hypothetical protein
MNLGDILSGIIGGIGRLIAELRKSRTAIQIMKLGASAIFSALAVYLGAIGVGISRTEALMAAAVTAAVIIITSGLREGFDIRLPAWLLERLRERTLPEGWMGSGRYVLVASGNGVLEAWQGAKFWTRGTVPNSIVVHVGVGGKLAITIASLDKTERMEISGPEPIARRVKTLPEGKPATLTIEVLSDRASILGFGTLPKGSFPNLIRWENEDVISPG